MQLCAELQAYTSIRNGQQNEIFADEDTTGDFTAMFDDTKRKSDIESFVSWRKRELGIDENTKRGPSKRGGSNIRVVKPVGDNKVGTIFISDEDDDPRDDEPLRPSKKKDAAVSGVTKRCPDCNFEWSPSYGTACAMCARRAASIKAKSKLRDAEKDGEKVGVKSKPKPLVSGYSRKKRARSVYESDESDLSSGSDDSEEEDDGVIVVGDSVEDTPHSGEKTKKKVQGRRNIKPIRAVNKETQDLIETRKEQAQLIEQRALE